jgi:hypothetical protein
VNVSGRKESISASTPPPVGVDLSKGVDKGIKILTKVGKIEKRTETKI